MLKGWDMEEEKNKNVFYQGHPLLIEYQLNICLPAGQSERNKWKNETVAHMNGPVRSS